MAVSDMVRGAELIIMVMVVVCVSQARADTGHATFYGGMDGQGTMGEWNSYCQALGLVWYLLHLTHVTCMCSSTTHVMSSCELKLKHLCIVITTIMQLLVISY